MITPGVCRCGCGKPTTMLRHDDPARGLRAGEYARFAHGHYHRWMRLFRPSWGQKTRDRCYRIAERICKEITEQRWDEIIGVAFEAAMEKAKKSNLIEDIELAVRLAVKKHFGQQISYGHASAESLAEAGWEIEDRQEFDDDDEIEETPDAR